MQRCKRPVVARGSSVAASEQCNAAGVLAGWLRTLIRRYQHKVAAPPTQAR